MGSYCNSAGPREKIFHSSSQLEDWELLSIIFGSGISGKDVYTLSKELLEELGGLGQLPYFRGTSHPLMKGLGKAKRAQLLAIAEISRRIATRNCERTQTAFPLLEICRVIKLQTQRLNRETLYLVNFSPEGKILRLEPISKGSMWQVGITKRELIHLILEDATDTCIIAHNHPSHSAKASLEDKKLFWELGLLLQSLGIHLIDHWVFGDDGIFSCRKNSFLDISQWEERKIPKEYNFLVDKKNV